MGAAAWVIAAKPTRLGLDLRGGVELVYEAQPTPKVPQVTPEAVNDALETIRKRTDALGVSEPEIQQAGQNQISIGLPDVENAARAIEQVGTTAQLQFYDWEPNLIGSTDRPFPTLYEAVRAASRAEPRAEPTDVPPNWREVPGARGLEGRELWEFFDRRNDTTQGARLYLFNPDHVLLAGPEPSCEDLLRDYDLDAGRPGEPTATGGCEAELRRLGEAGPPEGSEILSVPRGIVVVQAQRPDGLPTNVPVNQHWVLEDDSELSGADIENPEQQLDPQTNEPIVTMEFTDEGQEAFARVTKRIAERGASILLPPGQPPSAAEQSFAITLDNEIVSLASIDFVRYPEGIDGRTGAQINGIGSLEETQDLAESLRIGALPIELRLISQTQVSATLGAQALEQGITAGLAGLALTLLFLLLFYRVLGAVAALTLVVYAITLFALVKLIPITLTLPGIAGLILTLGVAADANIVVFERVKEEVRAGHAVHRAIASGYSKALRTIIDANVVTLGVAFILFMLATAGVRGFAFTLLVGTVVSLFTAVLATSAFLGILSRTRLLRSRFALGAGEERVRWRFDFMGASKWFFSASGVILLAGALAIAGLGFQLGIDFESGTRIKTPLERPATVAEVRDALAPLGFGDARIQQVDEPDLGATVFQISTPELQPEQVTQVEEALDERFGVEEGDFTNSSIGPTFGQQIAQTALLAIVGSLLVISIYIGVRFEFKYAVPVLIALFHDLLITAGVYAISGREVTASTVAALLTILGFSLYDTIIVFDRIRENVPRMPRATFAQIVNRSMSEVLTRSLVTNLCTLFPVTALMLFGGETLRDFGFALLVGVASGTYSSIFIAAPVLTAWKEREPAYRRRHEIALAEHDGVVPAFADAPGADGERPAAARRARPPARQPVGMAAPAPGPDRGEGAARSADGRAGNGGGEMSHPPRPPTRVPPVGEDPPPIPHPARPPEAAPARASDPDGGASDGDRASRNRRRKRHGRR